MSTSLISSLPPLIRVQSVLASEQWYWHQLESLLSRCGSSGGDIVMGVGVCVSVCLSVLGVGECECGVGCGRCIDMGVCVHVREMAGYVSSNDAALAFVVMTLH